MTDSIEGRRLHQLAEEARESGNYEKALEYTDQAALVYQKDHDLLGLSEVESSRQSTFKHLYRETGDPAFLVLEKHAALCAVEIAEKSGIPEALGIPYHNAGKYYFEAKEYQKAAEFFKKAVENLETYPEGRRSRPSVIADIKGHLFAAEYFAGDKNTLNRALQALQDLENASEDSTYSKNAWLTGAHLRIAEMVKDDNKDLSLKHLQDAERIIDQDKRQILRRKQLEKLKSSF